MRYVFLVMVCFLSFMVTSAQNYKINYKANIKPFEFKIEKLKIEDKETILFCKVKQQKNFSYSISFEDCYIQSPSDNQVINGTLKTWNEDKKLYRDSKTVSDEEDEKFTLSFPTTDIVDSAVFSIKIGNILDRNKTEIIFKDVPIKKR